MNNNPSIESLKEQLYNAESNYYWEYEGGEGKYSNLIEWCTAIFAGSLLPLFLLIVDDDAIYQPGFWLFSSVGVIMIFVSRYLFGADKHRCYHLTAQGIHYTEQDMIPEVAYKIVRGFAWVGIAVCIIAVFLLGPLALVGAGACALMSFGMTNFQPTADKCCLLMDERTVAFNLINDGVMSFAISEKGAHAFSGDVYISLEKKEALLSHLQLLFPNIEIVKIKRLNDQYQHPVYHQEDDKVTE
ncbi:hypothetical protein EJ063_03990 [Vibrio aquaticus]|uniref:Uncharacterized protein n=1 Tax=Vibrio aquaticus TaxID=2496559 RepID=A0A432D2A2_9VIBR|nr:hypothetical protein [Vibrio aquaticus]RTZ17958.1 hypothetical protein EJ063_03990 [Vibrio aquaticus]